MAHSSHICALQSFNGISCTSLWSWNFCDLLIHLLCLLFIFSKKLKHVLWHRDECYSERVCWKSKEVSCVIWSWERRPGLSTQVHLPPPTKFTKIKLGSGFLATWRYKNINLSKILTEVHIYSKMYFIWRLKKKRFADSAKEKPSSSETQKIKSRHPKRTI